MNTNIFKILMGLSMSFSTLINAQEQESIVKTKAVEVIIKADTTQVSFEGKLRPCLKYIVDADTKTLDKQWTNFVKKSYGAKVKEKENKYLITNDVRISAISDMRMDLLATVFGGEKNSVINFSGAFGYDIYIDDNAYPTEFTALQQMVETFLYDACNIYYHETLADLTKEIAKLNKKNQKATEDNIENKAKIIEVERDIETLASSEDTSSSKVMKKISKLSKKKVNYESNIAGHNEEITNNTHLIEGLKEKVAYFKGRQSLLNAQK